MKITYNFITFLFQVSHAVDQRAPLVESVFINLQQVWWLGTSANTCLLTRTAYLHLLKMTLSYDFAEVTESISECKARLQSRLIQEVFSELKCERIYPKYSPGLSDFFTVIFDICWLLAVQQSSVGGRNQTSLVDAMHSMSLNDECDVVDLLLQSCFCEVRLHVLQKLRGLVAGKAEVTINAVVASYAFTNKEPKTCDQLADKLLQSETVINRLIQMALTEPNHLCVIQVMYAWITEMYI